MNKHLLQRGGRATGTVAALLCVMLCAACNAAPGTAQPAATANNAAKDAPAASDTVVRVAVSGGIAGKSSEWTVHADGRVESSTGVKRQRTVAQIDGLRTALKSAGFFELADSYGGDKCRDCFVYDITAYDGGKSKTVRVTDDGKLPPAVSESLTKINALLAE